MYAKHREIAFFEKIGFAEKKLMRTDFGKRMHSLFKCIHLIATGNEDFVEEAYQEARQYNHVSFQELCYTAIWEGLILVFCQKYEQGYYAWKNLSGYSPAFKPYTYPYASLSREFDRALFKILFGKAKVEKIVDKLPVKELKGLAHFSAVNCRLIRKNEEVLKRIIEAGEVLGWKTIPDFQVSWSRLLAYEKSVLSNAGTLRE